MNEKYYWVIEMLFLIYVNKQRLAKSYATNFDADEIINEHEKKEREYLIGK